MFIKIQDGEKFVMTAFTSFVTTTCALDFVKYPFDTQVCNISYGNNYKIEEAEDFIVSLIMDNSTIVSNEFEVSLRPFKFIKVLNLGNVTEDRYSVVGFEMTLTRNGLPFLWVYYMPTFSMLLTSSMSFWIPPDAVPGRVSLLLTLALTMMNLFNGVQVSKCNSSDP